MVVQGTRRASARIQEKQEEKQRQLKRKVDIPGDAVEDGASNKKENNVYSRKRRNSVVASKKKDDTKNEKEHNEVPAQTTSSAGTELPNGSAVNVVEKTDGAVNVAEKSDTTKVKETLRLFNKHYLHHVQEEEKRCAKPTVDPKASKSKSKKRYAPEEDAKGKAKRPDLKAISKMMENNEILFPEKRIGDIPGINAGYQFYSRAEMVAVGFHSHWLNGIDYMGTSYTKGEYKNYKFPIAIAIVLSGMYEDDLDNADDVVYTGQGGHNLTGNKRQSQDQVLARGNLALKNCVEQNVPVRVIRGHKSSSSYTKKVYTYDGLYKVIQYWAEKGISGFTVFKFRLRRLEGQPLLTTNQVFFTYGRVPQSVSEIRGLVCEDITGGQENFPIPATNLVEDPAVAPTGFTYINTLQVAQNIKLPTNAVGCNCKGVCVDPRTCACAKLNGSDFPYVHRDGGRLIEPKDVVFECGPKCGCGPDCFNRTSQKGMMYRLEVFRTPKKGWAVRSWDFIPAGAPVCEYIGVLMRTEDVDNVSDNDNNYIFDIDCLQTMKGLGGRERRLGDVSIPTIDCLDRHEDQRSECLPEFCIDAGSTGNIARFINHSCEPNLFVQCVLSSHHDIKLARVVLFAADNIPPLQELTYDYGYALDSVCGTDGKVKKMPCFCGAADCRTRLF